MLLFFLLPLWHEEGGFWLMGGECVGVNVSAFFFVFVGFEFWLVKERGHWGGWFSLWCLMSLRKDTSRLLNLMRWVVVLLCCAWLSCCCWRYVIGIDSQKDLFFIEFGIHFLEVSTSQAVRRLEVCLAVWFKCLVFGLMGHDNLSRRFQTGRIRYDKGPLIWIRWKF